MSSLHDENNVISEFVEEIKKGIKSRKECSKSDAYFYLPENITPEQIKRNFKIDRARKCGM